MIIFKSKVLRQTLFGLIGLSFCFAISFYFILGLHGMSGAERFIETLQGTAVFLAGISLAITALSSIVSASRTKRLETLRAWSNWYDATKLERAKLIQKYGKSQPSSVDVKLLLTPYERTERNIFVSSFASEDELENFRQSLVIVLSGLERLSVGVQEGVYDIDTLRRIGGSIIKRTYASYRKYIIALQKHADEDIGFPNAYVSYCWLAEKMTNVNASEKDVKAHRANQKEVERRQV